MALAVHVAHLVVYGPVDGSAFGAAVQVELTRLLTGAPLARVPASAQVLRPTAVACSGSVAQQVAQAVYSALAEAGR
jgi:hypothetical protein